MTISDNINWRHTLYFTLSLIISPYLTVTPKYHFEMLYLCIVTQISQIDTDFLSPAEMKEIKESAFGTGCAQMSEANISAISFISAGQSKSKGPLIL